MQATGRRDTAAELAVRRALFRRGLRYRVDVSPLPGSQRRADIVFPRSRLAVYVDGCFWHGCPTHRTRSKSNPAFWEDKIATNQRRDADTMLELQRAGWTGLRVWEHEDPEKVADQVARLLRKD